MTIELSVPGPDGLADVVDALRTWQDDDAPLQLHPGDVGWFGRFGPAATAAALRTWRQDGRVVAVGLLDGPGLVRLAIAPDALRDRALARRLAADVSRPESGVLDGGDASVEAPVGALVDEALADAGWVPGEPWTLLRRELAGVGTALDAGPGLRVEVVRPEQADAWVAVVRASFDRSTFTAERWRAMASGPAFRTARCLLGYDPHGDAVAAVAVWSAGRDRPGLLEPMGVHRDHRGRGHGTAITLAAAAALRDLGASSALVATPTANVGAVATYASAGFRRLPGRRDRDRGNQRSSPDPT